MPRQDTTPDPSPPTPVSVPVPRVDLSLPSVLSWVLGVVSLLVSFLLIKLTSALLKLGRGFLPLPLCGACPFVGTVVFCFSAINYFRKKSYTPNGRGFFFDFYVTRGDSRERSSVVYIENHPLPLLTIYRFYGSPYMQLRHWSADRLTPGSWSAVSWGAETALAAVTAARMRWDSASPLPMRSRRSSTW